MWEIKTKQDGQVFGPVDLQDLKRWAANGQISPLDTITNLDTKRTYAPFEVPELEMIWEVMLEDGAVYGPTHANAVRVFVRDGQIQPKDTVRDILRGEKFMAGEFELYLEKQYPLQRAEPPPAVQTVAAVADAEKNAKEEPQAGEHKDEAARKDETSLRPVPPEFRGNAREGTTLRPVGADSSGNLSSRIRQLETTLKMERMNYEKLKHNFQDLNQRYIELKEKYEAARGAGGGPGG